MPDVYIGCYLKVWMPTETVELSTGKCPTCKSEMSCAYCPEDGAKIVFGRTEERPQSFYEYCADVFGDGDQFSTTMLSEDGYDYLIVTANLPTQTGKVWVERAGEYDMPTEDWSGDWQKLLAALERDGIRHEKHFGILVQEDW